MGEFVPETVRKNKRERKLENGPYPYNMKSILTGAPVLYLIARNSTCYGFKATNGFYYLLP